MSSHSLEADGVCADLGQQTMCCMELLGLRVAGASECVYICQRAREADYIHQAGRPQPHAALQRSCLEPPLTSTPEGVCRRRPPHKS